MDSDASDDFEDLFLNDSLENGILPHGPNVGLAGGVSKFSWGEKGRLTTTRLHPRTLSKDPYYTLSKKLGKGEKELDQVIEEFFTIQSTSKDTVGLRSDSEMTKKEAKAHFHIGSHRWSRVYKRSYSGPYSFIPLRSPLPFQIHTSMPNNAPGLTPQKTSTTVFATHPTIIFASISPRANSHSALSLAQTLNSIVSYEVPAPTAPLVNTAIPHIHHQQLPPPQKQAPL